MPADGTSASKPRKQRGGEKQSMFTKLQEQLGDDDASMKWRLCTRFQNSTAMYNNRGVHVKTLSESLGRSEAQRVASAFDVISGAVGMLYEKLAAKKVKGREVKVTATDVARGLGDISDGMCEVFSHMRDVRPKMYDGGEFCEFCGATPRFTSRSSQPRWTSCPTSCGG